MPISRFRGEFFYLSNFFPCRHAVEFDGDLYPTSEHAYQAAKIEERSVREPFTCGGSLGDNPMDAKRKGGKVKKRPNWDSKKVSIMLAIVRSKFACDRDFQKKLIATKGQTIIEGHTNDNFWGGTRNHLGHILMKVRDELADAEQRVVPIDCARCDDEGKTTSAQPKERCKGRVDRRATFQERVDVWLEESEFVHTLDASESAVPIDEVCEASAPAPTGAVEVDLCTGCMSEEAPISPRDQDPLADAQPAFPSDFAAPREDPITSGQAGFPQGFAAWLSSALDQELDGNTAESGLCAMEVILGEPEDLQEALKLAADALQELGASKAAGEVKFRWLFYRGACEAGGHRQPAALGAAQARGDVESVPLALDSVRVPGTKLVQSHIADAQIGEEQVASAAPEKHGRPRGGRSGFRRKYDADHM